MREKIVFSPGSFFHGTKANLKIGDLIITGKKIIKIIENPNMFILRELWTRQSGEPNWRKGTAAREYMLSNQPGIMRTTPILRTRNFPEIPQNPTGQSSR